MTPSDKAIIAAQAEYLSALIKESGVKCVTAVQVGNPHRRGFDPVWPTPLVIIEDYLKILS